MKKVGLVTYYGDNYGGCLQAYALQNTINKFDCECQIIKYEWISKEPILKYYFRKIMAVGNVFKYIKRRNIIRNNYVNFSNRAKSFQIFRDEHLKIDNNTCVSIDDYYKNPPEYDYYVCGSDQIWNPNLYDRCNPIYFLDFVPKGKKRIAYAPSIGVNNVAEKYKTEMADFLKGMDNISVRELVGSKIVKELIGKDAPTVLDPTLLLTAEEWLEMDSKVNIEEPYILCYLFSDLEYIDKVKNYVKEKTGLKIVCLPFSTRELSSDDKKIFKAGPAEFVNLIKNAKLVLTDSFHATVFSINMKTPFYSLLRAMDTDTKNMNSRLYSILKLCDLEDRILSPSSMLPRGSFFDINFDKSERFLVMKRKEDMSYLKKALEK